jgi:DNA-binding transcriptional regulator YhcF (GntR family)
MEEVLAELSRLERERNDGPEGFTCRELACRLGVVANTAQSRLRDLVYAGRVELAGKRIEINVAGSRCQVPVYRLRKAQS